MADDAFAFGRVTSGAVREATGRGWQQWLEALDEVDASDWDHKGIVAHLERFDVPAGGGFPAASGEVRVVKPGDRLRMTWHPEGWAQPATLQLALTSSGSGKTAIRCHLEKLPDADAREATREHWRDVLDRIGRSLPPA